MDKFKGFTDDQLIVLDNALSRFISDSRNEYNFIDEDRAMIAKDLYNELMKFQAAWLAKKLYS